MKLNLLLSAIAIAMVMLFFALDESWLGPSFGLTSRQMSEASVIVLGSSTERLGIEEKMLDPSALKLTILGAGADSWRHIWEGLSPRLTNLRTIILPANSLAMLLSDAGESTNRISGLVRSGADPLDLPGISPQTAWEWKLRTQTPLSRLLEMHRLDFEHVNGVWSSLIGSGGEDTISNITANSGKKHKLHWVEGMKLFQHPDRIRINEEAYRSVLEQAREMNLNVVLVRLPVVPSYHEIYDEEWNGYSRRLDEAADDVLGADGYILVDMSNDTDFSLDCFVDGVHMSEKGRELATQRLRERIERFLNNREHATLHGHPQP